ncbi:hypothetical protein [Pseudomonas capeferrum]
MYGALTHPLVLDNVQQFFNDLITLADPEYQRFRVRHHAEAYRIECLAQQPTSMILNQIIGFLDGLVASDVLTLEQGRDFHQRLIKGIESAWMRT